MNHRHESRTGEVVTRLFMFFIGLLMAIPAAYKLSTYCSFRFLGTTASGTVVHSSSGREWGGRPLVQYEDGDGNLHEFKSKAKTHWFKRPLKGENVEIFIGRDEPHGAIVNNFYYYVFLPLLLLGGGCYCCLKSIWFHLSRQR